jgi:hypothetical protein
MSTALDNSMSPAQLRCLNRWYPLIDHPTQLSLINDTIRFKVVPAGRRSGKTERFKRFMAKTMMATPGEPYFIAAPTRNQVKKIYWEDMKLLCFAPLLNRDAVSESELTIRLPNGSSVTLIGLDQPQRIEGTFWAGGGIDEIADVKENAWAENISPALDTFNPLKPDYRAWCWLLGVPDGLNHYYEMAEYARTADDPDWKLYTWHSSDILPDDVIAAAKRRMSKRQYRQEYEASFETASGKIYEDYSPANYTKATIKPHEQLLWFHDFNYTPLSSGIGVRRNKHDLYILDEIILTSAVAKQSALEFVDRYKDHQNRDILLYGDPAGRAGEKHGHASDYTEMEEILRKHNWKVKRQVKNAAPAIKDRQNAVRAKIRNAADEISLYVNPQRAPYCHKGLATVQLKQGSTFLEEDGEYQHITTAIGYCVDHIWPITMKKDFSDVVPLPSKNHYKRMK